MNPYPIYGLFLNHGAGELVYLFSIRTGESDSVRTESDSSYLLDPANFPNEYIDGDQLRVQSGDAFKIVTIDIINSPDGIKVDLLLPSLKWNVVDKTKRMGFAVRGAFMNKVSRKGASFGQTIILFIMNKNIG